MQISHEEKGYEQILEEHRPMIWRICCGYLKDEALRHDLYQEISINLWKNLSSFRGDAALSTWVYRIAVNSALAYFKKEQRQQERFKPLEGQEFREEKVMDDKEKQLELLYQCIHALPKVERLLMTCMLEGLAYKEIAEVMGMSVSLVGVKLNRIKKKITKRMEVQYGHA